MQVCSSNCLGIKSTTVGKPLQCWDPTICGAVWYNVNGWAKRDGILLFPTGCNVLVQFKCAKGRWVPNPSVLPGCCFVILMPQWKNWYVQMALCFPGGLDHWGRKCTYDTQTGNSGCVGMALRNITLGDIVINPMQ